MFGVILSESLAALRSRGANEAFQEAIAGKSRSEAKMKFEELDAIFKIRKFLRRNGARTNPNNVLVRKVDFSPRDHGRYQIKTPIS